MEVKLSKQQKVTVNGSEDIYLIMRQILRREINHYGLKVHSLGCD